MNNKIALIFIVLVLITPALKAQQQEAVYIKQLCGCYDVAFQYAETFAPDSSYEFHERETAHARELITPIEVTDKKIVLQHMLVVNENYIIKHWREDWVYESPVILNYTGNNTWVKQSIAADKAKGTWTQTVWQVDDVPRYQGYSAWINNNGNTYWENTAYAPLPRREYSKRSDYNLMKRTNKIITGENGWVHEQDNDKIIRNNKGDKLLVQEKGVNTYIKIADNKCAKALEDWNNSKDFWVVVRNEWQSYIEKYPVISVKDKVDDQKLYEHFYGLEHEWKEQKMGNKELAERVREVMSKFVTGSMAMID